MHLGKEPTIGSLTEVLGDLANRNSNSIYQKIGCRADHDAEERAFDD
jgi:hypothetical protein